MRLASWRNTAGHCPSPSSSMESSPARQTRLARMDEMAVPRPYTSGFWDEEAEERSDRVVRQLALMYLE